MAKKRNWWGLIIPIFVILLALIINHYGSEFLDGPKVIPVSSSPTVSTICPTSMSFDYKGGTTFVVGFLNGGGNDGDFTVTINSQDILTKTQNPGAQFGPSSTLTYTVLKDVKRPVNYNFALNMTDVSKPPPAISIGMTLQCTGYVGPLPYTCQGISDICNYTRDPSGQYDLQ